MQPDLTLGELIEELNLGDWFRHYYMLAMGAAIWSTPLTKMTEFPAKAFVQFFENHGLLTYDDQPQWYTVSGGSRTYVNALKNSFKNNVKLSSGALSVQKNAESWIITDDQTQTAEFDQVIFACHANEALALIETPSDSEQQILSKFKFQPNKIVTHTDTSFMPKNLSCWSSWVYLSEQSRDAKPLVSLTYWMNNLQNLASEKPILVTLNPARQPLSSSIIDEHIFSHPMFNKPAKEAQQQISQIQGRRGLWFCGAYLRFGFHEDGLLSAVNVVKKLGVKIPWD